MLGNSECRQSPLREEVQALRNELREQRRVITHQEAPKFFNDRVSARRVKEYIKGKNLPQDAPGPLPAKKMGNLYFIELDTLYDWQIGNCRIPALKLVISRYDLRRIGIHSSGIP